MTRGRALGGLAVVVALIAAAAFFLLHDDGAGESERPLALTAQDDAARRSSGAPLPPVQPADATRKVAVAPMHADVPELATPDVPESYRAALGGLTGRILEARSGGEDPRPVPDFRVELVGSRSSVILSAQDAIRDPEGMALHPVAGSAVTDAEGRFLLSGLEPRTFGALVLDPGGPRAMLHLLEQSPVSGETHDLGDIVLPLTVTLTGTVVDERDRPIEGARVRSTDLPLLDSMADIADFRAGGGVLVPSDTSGLDHDILFIPPPGIARMESRLPIPTAYSDAEGRFELTGVPAGLVALVVDHGRYRPQVRAGVATGAAGGTRDVGRLPVADGHPLAVRVKDGDGQPVTGAEVLAGSVMTLAPVAIMKQPARTTEAGTAEFEGLAEGVAWVAARGDPRHEFTLVPVDDVAVGTFTVTLAARRELHVFVRDTNGEPVTRASFHGRVTPESEMPDILLTPKPLGDRTRPGEDDGRYVIEDLAPGGWELTAFADGYASERIQVDLDATTAAEFTLRRGLTLEVSVVGALDGAPVEWALVQAWGEDGLSGLDLFEGPTTARRTDAAGRTVLRDLPEGDVRLQVSHPSWAVIEEHTEVPRDEELVIALPVGGSILGQITDQGGPPAEPLYVYLHASDGEGDDEMPRFTMSDLDGMFHFDRVPPGDAEVAALSRAEFGSGLSFVETFFNSPLAEADVTVVEGTEARVELVVGAVAEGVVTGYLRGVLVVNGLAAPGWRIRTWGAIRRSATTDENGAWDLGRIEAGDVRIMLNAPGQAITGGWTEMRELELAPEEQRYERIDLSTGVVIGRVVFDATGAPVGAAEVRLRSEGEQGGWTRQPRTITSVDGSFRFEPVVVGKYRVTAETDGHAQSSSDPFELHALELRSGITLRLHEGLSLTGSVRLQGIETEPRFVRLVARSADGKGSENARVDMDDMSFRFDNLGPGAWTFHVASDLDADFAPVTMELTRDLDGQELVFEVEPEEIEEGGQAPFVYEEF